MRSRHVILACAVFALALAASPSLAQTTYTWTGASGVDMNWSTPANWNDGGVGGVGPPAAGDSAIINLTADPRPTINLDASSAALVNYSSTNARYMLSDGGAANVLTVNGTMNLSTGGVPEWQEGVYFNAVVAGTGQMVLNPTGGNNYAYVQLNRTNTYSGGTTVTGSGTSRDTWLLVNADRALGTGTVVVSSTSASKKGLLFLNTQQNYGGLNPAQPLIRIDSGGQIQCDLAGADLQLNITLNGGQFYLPYQSRSLAGTLTVQSESYFTGDNSYLPIFDLKGDILGSAKLNVNASPSRQLSLNYANASFTGEWNVTNGYLNINNDRAAGTGTITIGNAGTVRPSVAQTTMNPVVINAGGTLNMTTDIAAGASITLNGGYFGSSSDAGRSWAMNADLNVTASSEIGSGGNSNTYSGTYNGDIIGSGVTLAYNPRGGTPANQVGILNHANVSYTGQWQVKRGTLRVDQVGALGTGTVVANGGVIASNTTDAFASPSLITADLNGEINLMSTENNADLLIKAGGGFQTSNAAGQASVLNYTGTPVAGQTSVGVERGAILNTNLLSFPTLAQLLTGTDTGFGVFKATSSGNHSVGLYSGTIYRGLALAAGNVTYSGTITETPATPPDPDPTAGIGMYAGSAANFTYQNSTFTAVNANTIKFYGAGGHIIGNGNAFSGNLEQFGIGMVQVNASGAISGKTLTVRSGYLDTSQADSLSGAVVNIEAGGSFYLDQTPSAGTVNVRSGAAVYAVTSPAQVTGSAVWNWSSGSQIGFGGDSAATLPSPGDVSYVGYHGNETASTLINTTIVLGSDTRLMAMPNADGSARRWNVGGTGLVTLDVGATQGTLAGVAGGPAFGNAPYVEKYLYVANRVDFGTGTLIVGDATGTFTVVSQSTGRMQQVSTAGVVSLGNEGIGTGTANAIGNIDVRSGTLHVTLPQNLGNPTTVNLAAGTTLLLAHGNAMAYTNPWPLSGVYGGNGTIVAQDGAAGRYVRVTPDGVKPAALSPGASAGTLNISGSLRFGAPIDPDATPGSGDETYGQLLTEVMTHANVPGASHDLLAVTGNAILTNGQLVVSLPLPGPALKPTTPDWSQPGMPTGFIIRNLGDMTVLTAGVAVTGTFASAVVDADPRLAGVQSIGPWKVKAGAALADYSVAKTVVVKGADIVWMALPGDANLDRAADVSDLSLLAGNFRKTTGQTWLQGDFNFDGAVDVSDLSLLAGRFRQTNPFPPAEGGAPVPEPMTMVLLGLGGLAVLARRRR